MSPSSSSLVQNSNLKRQLNPNASSYEPIQPVIKPYDALDKICLPHQFPPPTESYEATLLLSQPPVEPSLVYPTQAMPVDNIGRFLGYGHYSLNPLSWNNTADYLTMYSPSTQPNPQMTVFNGSHYVPYDGINYGSETMLGKKKKKVRCRYVPPRLNALREHHVHRPDSIWVPRSANNQKTEAGGVEERVKLAGLTSLMIRNIPNHFG